MKIGIFDSGMGGLVILKAVIKTLPEFSYTYLGDTQHLPYGSKSDKQIYNLTKRAVDFLFKNNCKLVVVACNSSSAVALRKLQKEWLVKKYPNRKILGVIVPTIEIVKAKKVGVIATKATVKSKAFSKELKKVLLNVKVYEQAAPLLVTYIESNNFKQAIQQLKIYLKPLLKKDVDTLILGCTHYPLLKKEARRIVGKNIKVISQDEVVPQKLKKYLKNHPEIVSQLEKKSKNTFLVTKINSELTEVANSLFGKSLKFKKVVY